MSYKVLYDSNGVVSYNNITLNEDISNFSMIEIIYGASNNMLPANSDRTFVSNGRAVFYVSSIIPSGSDNFVVRNRSFDINGKTVAAGSCQQYVVYRGGYDYYNINSMPLLRVIGYK